MNKTTIHATFSVIQIFDLNKLGAVNGKDMRSLCGGVAPDSCRYPFPDGEGDIIKNSTDDIWRN